MRAARRYAGIAGLSSVLLVFSEFVFLNEAAVAPLLTDASASEAARHVGALLLFYFLFGAIFAAVVSAYGAATVAALMLAGALCGWGIEAVLVPVAYEAVPFSFAWPSLGWHMLVNVGLGLWLLPALMASRTHVAALALTLAMGLLWGIWASWVWIEGLRPDPARFALYAAGVIALLIAGYAVLGRAGAETFAMGRVERMAVAILAVAPALVVGHPFMPWPIVLAGLVAATLAALSRGTHGDRGLTRLPLAVSPLAPGRLALLAGLAPGAAAGYAWMHARGRPVEVDLVAAPLIFAGSAVFLWAVWVLFTRG